MTKEKIEKCWMCNRTAEKALNDFRELILESTETFANDRIVIPNNIKNIIKDQDVLPIPADTKQMLIK